MQKFNEPLLALSKDKNPDDIKAAIDNAFPVKRFITFVAKCTEHLLRAGVLELQFAITRYYTTEPKCNPLIFPYLYFVENDDDFVRKHTSKVVVSL